VLKKRIGRLVFVIWNNSLLYYKPKILMIFPEMTRYAGQSGAIDFISFAQLRKIANIFMIIF